MDLKSLNKEDLNNLRTLIQLLESEKIFNHEYPHKEVEFEINKISIFQQAHDQSGFPSKIAIPKYRFNYKDLFKKLDKAGILSINKDYLCLAFLGWRIKTNLQALLNLKIETNKLLNIYIKQNNENVIEVLIRDVIRNNPTLKYPTSSASGFKIPKFDEISKENIQECGECDIVCRSNGEIVSIIEITVGAITEDYIKRRIPKRIQAAPKAKIWIIASRINSNISNQLKSMNVDSTIFKQLKNSYPKIFNFL